MPESVHVNNWLKKRGLSWEKFQSLVKGKLAIVPLDMSTRHRSNMLRGGELEPEGPAAEVDYWKSRLSRFASLQEQLKAAPTQPRMKL